MKKITTLLLVLFSSYTFAQEKESLKGSWWVAGYFNAQTSSSETSENQSFYIMPTIGKFISDDVSIGVGLGVSTSKNTNIASDYDTKNIGFTVQPLVRKYWGIAKKIYVFGQSTLPLSISTYKRESPDFKEDYFNVSLNFAPGIDYRISKKFSVETYYNVLGIGYNHVKDNYDNTSDGFYFSGNSNTSLDNLTVGIKYHF